MNKPTVQHRNADTDLKPHANAQRKLLAQPMPGSPKPDAYVSADILEGEAERSDEHANPNADLVLHMQNAHPPQTDESPVYQQFQSHPHFRQTAQRQRCTTPLDATDEATLSVLRQPFA